MIKFEKHVTVTDSAQTLIDILSNGCDLSRQRLKDATHKGAVWLTRKNSTKRIRRFKKALEINDVVHLYYDQSVLEQSPNEAILVSDEKVYSVWYKPYGMLSQGSKWSDHCTIARWAESHLNPQRPAYIVHRLDRAATGLIVVAHSKTVAKELSKLFELRALKKCYQIICHGKLNKEEIITVKEPIDNKPATSHFSLIDYDIKKDLSLVQVEIETGRKHQIRKHAAFIGHSVYGDRLHGIKKGEHEYQSDLQLCAVRLMFECPIDKKKKVFELPATLKPSFNKVTG